MIAFATASASLLGSGCGRAPRPVRIRSIGRRRPITPVWAMSTSLARAPRWAATAVTISDASARPWSPVATFAFFEVTTTALARPDATLVREMRTLGPAKCDWVNIPAAEHTSSAATTTKSRLWSLIPRLVTWQRNPAGRSRVTAQSLAERSASARPEFGATSKKGGGAGGWPPPHLSLSAGWTARSTK